MVDLGFAGKSDPIKAVGGFKMLCYARDLADNILKVFIQHYYK